MSVVEVGGQDNRQSLHIGVPTVGSDRP
ncbi:MAG: hypothetical protein ACKVK9_01265 [Nitrospinaceae bacterium]